MRSGRPDGSAGDVDYAAIGRGYAAYRQPDPRIAIYIDRALGSAQRVLNVGAGSGSYEPRERDVSAVEPSAAMRAQRPRNLAAAIDAVAENLPFADDEFEASMATFTIHQWTDLERGLREMRRVTRGTIILLTCDPQLVQRFWLNDYAPDVLATEARRYPSMTRIREALGERIQEIGIPIPLDCKDGFNEAYYGRPERLLDDDARLACSAWSLVSAEVCDRYVDHLRRDLRTGAWDSQFRHLRGTPFYDGALRLIVATS